MKVEVFYASVHSQRCIALNVTADCSARTAITQSGILQEFPEIDLNTVKIGIFSRKVDVDHLLCEGDRIEIYRPLLCDPKQKRRERAKLAKKSD